MYIFDGRNFFLARNYNLFGLKVIFFSLFSYRYGEKQRKPDAPDISGIQLLSATAYQLKKPYQQLLIPITVWIGMEQAFIGAEFTQVRIYNNFMLWWI